jgi:hypothetical protein
VDASGVAQAWETIASGRPLLQGLNFTSEDYRETFGHEPPPILDVQSPDDVERHLWNLYRNPEMRASIGSASKQWFDQNNGISLARSWLDMLQDK